jgi:hypothetical protein
LPEQGLDTALCFFVGQIGGARLRNDRHWCQQAEYYQGVHAHHAVTPLERVLY